MPDRPAASDPDFSLYIVRCADGTLYTGIATDVEKRLTEHAGSSRGAKFLRGRGPLELVYREVVGDRALASRAEYRVKKLSRRRKLELVSGRVKLSELVVDQVVDDECA